MKKSVSILCALCLAAAVTGGCGSKSEPEQSGVSETTVSKTTVETIKGADQEAEKTVITVWSGGRHDAEFIQKKVQEYNDTNTDNIQVVYEIYSDNYTQAVDIAFQSGETPDIFAYTEDIYNKYLNAGKFADLTPFMDDQFKETFQPCIVEGVNADNGVVRYIPTGCACCRLFYNKTLFDELGLEVPKNLEEMVECAKTITEQKSKDGIYGFAQNLNSNSSALKRSLIPMAENSIGIKYGYDFGKGAFDFTGYRVMLEGWRQLMDYAFPGCEALDIDSLRAQFADGKIGMYFSYNHAEPGVYTNQFPMTEYEWGCAEIPVPEGVARGAQDYEAQFAYLLNADGPAIEQAWKAYTSIFADLDFLTEYYEQGFGVSVVPAVLERAKAGEAYQKNPSLLLLDSDIIWPDTPDEKYSDVLIVEGLNFYDTFGELI